jgi:hypothetical protein
MAGGLQSGFSSSIGSIEALIIISNRTNGIAKRAAACCARPGVSYREFKILPVETNVDL